MDFLDKRQVRLVERKTPKEHVYQKKIGGRQFSYVKGSYVKSVLNEVFKYNWSYKILNYEYLLDFKQVVVHGKLTIRSNGVTVVRHQFGKSEIEFKDNKPVNLGDDLKAAGTDGLKKCASEIGICSDIYKDDNTDVKPSRMSVMDKWALIKKENSMHGGKLSEDNQVNVERIINKEESNSYDKVLELFSVIKKTEE